MKDKEDKTPSSGIGIVDAEDKTPLAGTEIIRDPNTGIIKRFINWIITGFTDKPDDQ